MLKNNTKLEYAFLLFMSMGKKSFSELGRTSGQNNVAIKRILNSTTENFLILEAIARSLFERDKELVLSIDDTLLKKQYSTKMEGACEFFDTKIGKKIMSYKALVAGLTNGKQFVPIFSDFLFSKEVFENANEEKDKLIKAMIIYVIQQFSDKIITVAVDGAFATKKLFLWAIENNIRLEARMHSNRVITYQNEPKKIRDIKSLQPKGRHMARTIQAIWHDMSLYITAERRIDKHGEESIVYQASTYQVKPLKHVVNYKCRWANEKFFRTGKQSLGLQDCFSTRLEVQRQHLSSVLLAYALLQIEMKKRKLTNPEDAIRCFKAQKLDKIKKGFYAMDEIFANVYV